jgi:hypothetical protein
VKGLWAIAIILLLTAGGSRAARTRRIEAPPVPPSRSTASRLRMVWRVAEWAIGTLAALLALALTTYSAAGPFWRTPPEIALQEADRLSSVPLPFNVATRNVFFPISAATLICHVDLLYFVDADNKTGIWRDAEFGPLVTALPSSYDCGADFLRVREDGSVEIGFPHGQSMYTRTGAFRGPITVVKMCVMIGGFYVSRGVSAPIPVAGYQWPSAPGGTGWIREPIAFDIDQDKWIPPGSYLQAAWAVAHKLTIQAPDGTMQLDPDALRCDMPPKQ